MGSPPVDSIGQLRHLADQLAGSPAPAAAAAATEQAEALYAAIDRLEAAAAVRVQTVDAAGEAKADGCTSTTAWLREACGMRGSRASERVTVARQLRRLPETADRFANGDLGYCAAAVLARVVRNLNDTDTANTALCCPCHNRFKNRHPDRVEVTRHPNGKITYRILGRHRRNNRRNTRPARDGPHRQAA